MSKTEIEMLRQMTLNVAARVGVLETIAEGLLVALAAQHGRQNLQAVCNWMMQAHNGKPLEEGPQELAQWLRQQELARLRALCEHVLLAADEVAAGKKTALN